MDAFFLKLLYKLISGKQKLTLEQEFLNRVHHIKEFNSKTLWDYYYIPKAVREILEKYKTISEADNQKITLMAQSLLFRDLAEGKIDDLYRFNESEV